MRFKRRQPPAPPSTDDLLAEADAIEAQLREIAQQIAHFAQQMIEIVLEGGESR